MLNTVASWATIISAVPVAIAASVFLFWTVPKAVNQPKGLRLGLEPAIGDPGCCVHVTNYGPVERYISRVGAMPAHLRPRWSVCTKRINPKGDLRESLAVFTVWAMVDQTIEPGRRLALLVPQPLPLDRELPDYELESRRGITRSYYEWLKQDQPAGRYRWCRTSSSATAASCLARRHESSRHHSAWPRCDCAPAGMPSRSMLCATSRNSHQA